VNNVATRKLKKMSIAVGLLMMVGVLSAVQSAGTSAAQASSSLTAAQAGRAAAPAQAPISQVCTAQGATSLCANRNAGATAPGTYVIAWSAGDPNDDFAIIYLSGACGHGKVTANPPCPFTPNGGLNSKYNGRMIAKIYNWETELCVADSGTGSGATVLDKCPDADGNGGADGTIFVLSQLTSPVIPPTTTYAVNRYWSNSLAPGGGAGTKARWLCTVNKGYFLIENNPSGVAGRCQWREA
jgi:hypothetical protein